MGSDVDGFIGDGFAVLRGVFGADRLPPMRAALSRIEEAVTADPALHETRYTSRTDDLVDAWGVNHVFAPGLYEPVLAAVFAQRRVMDLVRAVLGQRLRFWGGHALWAPRHVDYELGWHRDFGEHDVYEPSGASTHVQFNVCLLSDDCFRVIPGSHRRQLTAEEAEQQRHGDIASLPGELSVHCDAGDVLLMNAHALHRGSCAVGTPRQTLHISVQPFDEPSGGQASWRFMRVPGYLDGLPAPLRDLMGNAVEWDDAHPLSMVEARRRLRNSREIKRHVADGGRATADA